MARPKIQIDLEEVEQLAAGGLSQAEIATSLGISSDTVTRRKQGCAGFAAAFERGRNRARIKVSSKLFELACAGNVAAAKWWETSRLGLSAHTKSDVTVRTFEQWVAGQTEDPFNVDA